MSQRTEVLSWDDYFMSLAFLSSQRSKDPATQVGAVIVNVNQRIIGIGYNGFPHGCSDEDLPWCKTGDWSDTKYPFGELEFKKKIQMCGYSVPCRNECHIE